MTARIHEHVLRPGGRVSRGISLALPPADRTSRTRDALLLGFLGLWLAYTRLWWAARAIHVGLPACPFLALTGHPCPFCGGTRSFAYVWRGDLGRATAMYPLGPALFAGAVIAALGLALLLVGGRRLEVGLSAAWRWGLIAGAGTLLGLSWALKLTVLPN